MNSLGITLDEKHSVRMWASRSEEWACLVIETDGTYCEIRMDRVHVEALRDHLPGVLAGLDRWAAEDAAREGAEAAGQRAVDVAAAALDQAVAAEQAGAHALAVSLRAAVAEVTGKADAVDAAVRAFGNAAEETDHATELLVGATSDARKALHRLRDDGRPAELATP